MTTPAPTKPDTHYIPYFTRDGAGGTQEAACTAFVDQSCHSPEPTCWGCRAWLDDDVYALQKLRNAETNGSPKGVTRL